MPQLASHPARPPVGLPADKRHRLLLLYKLWLTPVMASRGRFHVMNTEGLISL